MSLSDDLRTKVQATAGITSLIGERFRPQIAEQDDDLPYTIYSRTARRGTVHSGGEANLVVTNVVMTHFAETYNEAESIAEQFRVALNVLAGVTIGSTPIRSCVLVLESDSLEVLQFAQNDAPHFITQEWEIKHNRTPSGL